jgi:hypothetical protein
MKLLQHTSPHYRPAKCRQNIFFRVELTNGDWCRCHRWWDVKKAKSGWCAPTCFSQEDAAQWSSDSRLRSEDPGRLHRSPSILYVDIPNGERTVVSPPSRSGPLRCMLSAVARLSALAKPVFHLILLTYVQFMVCRGIHVWPDPTN